MKKLRQAAISVIIALAPAAILAQVGTMPVPSEELRGELRAQGIDASQLDWVVIDGLCAVYRPDSGLYQQCLKRKSVDVVSYQRDRSSCQRIASEEAVKSPYLPPFIWPQNPPIFSSQQQKHHYYRNLHRSMHYAGQPWNNNSYQNCMENRGWVDSDNWKAGRK